MLVLISVFITSLLLYLYGTRNFSYWRNKGIKHDPPIPFFGNNFKQLTFREALCNVISEQYRKYPKERFVGFYFASQKVLILREPRDIQQVLVTDFRNFHERGLRLHVDEKDTFFQNLVMADGDIWKLLRNRMMTAFTPGKLKAMFYLIAQTAEKLQKLATDVADKSEEIDVKALMSRYTINVIGAVGFGIDTRTLDDENSSFHKLGRRIFKVKAMDIIRKLLKISMPMLFKNLDAVAPEIKNATTDLVMGILKERNYEPSSRNDFIDLMLKCKMEGKMIGESIESRNPDGSPMIIEEELNDDLIVAQVFAFFAAGFETSSSVASFVLHQLALHQKAQQKCQQELDIVLKKYDNKLCYDAIQDLTYLNMVVLECMRLFPSIAILFRQSVCRYTFPDSDLTIDKGVRIIIPTHALQMDEKYFPNPYKFDPERFNQENINKHEKFAYLPYGDGLRSCIGKKLGKMQALAGLAAILTKFSVVPSKNTKRDPIADPLVPGMVQIMKGGNPLKLISRKTNGFH